MPPRNELDWTSEAAAKALDHLDIYDRTDQTGR
jgi:hypothetical protein